jgi:hypothetical protein
MHRSGWHRSCRRVAVALGRVRTTGGAMAALDAGPFRPRRPLRQALRLPMVSSSGASAREPGLRATRSTLSACRTDSSQPGVIDPCHGGDFLTGNRRGGFDTAFPQHRYTRSMWSGGAPPMMQSARNGLWSSGDPLNFLGEAREVATLHGIGHGPRGPSAMHPRGTATLPPKINYLVVPERLCRECSARRRGGQFRLMQATPVVGES